jgi:hypothetical protein
MERLVEYFLYRVPLALEMDHLKRLHLNHLVL